MYVIGSDLEYTSNKAKGKQPRFESAKGFNPFLVK